MRISVVINTYNRLSTLPLTLEALRQQRYPDLEVIVVNGPSDDGTSEYIAENWSRLIKCCECSEANLSMSRNVGIRNASGDIVCFTDDDGIPEPDWLEQLVKAYEDPKVAAAGGWVRDHTGIEYQTKYIVSTRDSGSEVLIENEQDFEDRLASPDSFPGLIGVNSSFRRSALLEIGGFDEEFAYFLDETDVLARLVDAGFLVKMVPSAEVHHKYAPSHIRAKDGIAKSWLQIMKSTAYYIIKNAGPEASLMKCLERVQFHGDELRRHTRWFHSVGKIDAETCNRLMKEIEDGIALGIKHAFEFPIRQLIASQAATAFMPFRRRSASDRIRIALVSGLYPPRPSGGVAVFMHTLATYLAAAGHEVTVLTQAEAGRPDTVDFEEGVWVHRLSGDQASEPVFPEGMPDLPPGISSFAGRVLAELDRINSHRDVQYVLGSLWDLELVAVIASGRYVTGMYLVTSYKIMESSKPEWRENQHYYENHVSKMIKGENWAIRNCSMVLSSTQAILRDLESIYDIQIPASRVQIIPFGVPALETANNSVSVADHETPSVLFVGRLEERKGIDTFLEALPEILASNNDLQVDIVGDDRLLDSGGGTYRKNFEARFSGENWFGRVRFHGHVSADDLANFYRRCSVFVAPSKYESFGLIYLEAMRFGKPCIGSDVGGIPEVVVDGVTGILIQPGNAQSLSSAIINLIDDPSLQRSLGNAGQHRFRSTFTADKFAEAIVAHVKSQRAGGA